MKKLKVSEVSRVSKVSKAIILSGVFVLFAVLSFTVYVATAKAATGVNRQINFQGKLVDNNGLNVADNTYTVVFSLYYVSSGGTNIWTETDSVTTKAGIFQVQLGANTPLPDNVYFNQDNLYLGIKVGADTEMTPRIRFTAVPYALNSASLDGVVATQSATGFNLQGGTGSQSNVSFNTTGGALTFQPGVAEGLTIDTNGANTLSLGNSAGAINFGGTNNPGYVFNGTGGLTLDGNAITIGNGSNSTIQTTGTNSGLTLLSQGSGNITLGQNAGNGNVVISPNAGGQAALIVQDMGSGDLFTASAGANAKFTIQNDGTIVDAKYTGSSNGVIYATSANGTLTTTTTTTTPNQCLLSGSSTPGWGACALGANLLQLNSNALSPNNSSYDFLLGATATNSAKFAFINNAGAAVPVASISATILSGGNGNGLVVTGSGSLQSLNKNSLILGGTTTGNILFQPNADTTNNLKVTSNGSGITLGTSNASPLTVDTGGAAALNLGTTNATSLVLGSSNVSSITLNTSGTGDSAVVLPAQSIGANEIVNNSLDFTKFADSQTLDATTTVNFGANSYLYNLNSTGNFDIQDAGNNFAQFLNDGTITLGKSASASTLNLGTGTGADTIHIGDNNTTGDTLTIGNNNASTTLSLAGGTTWSIDTSGNATLGGTSITSLTGAGLSSCNSSTSKLLYNSSSGLFTCGVDNGSSLQAVEFVDTTQDAAVSFTTPTNLWTGTNPNITPAATTDKIQVAITVKGSTSSTNDQNPSFRLYRTTDGSTPSCSSTQVGQEFYGGYETNTGRKYGATAVFIDTPSTTNTVKYTVCTGSGGLSSGNVDATTVDLTEFGPIGGSGGGSSNLTVETADSTTSVPTVSTLEFGPSTSSTDQFIVTNLSGGNAQVTLGNQVALLNALATVTGGWTFNTAATTFTTAINANGGIDTTTSNQNLTLAANGTGNIVFNTTGTSSVGIGTSTPLATLDVRGNTATTPVASFSGATNFAAMVVNNSGNGDLFAASSSGVSQFVIKNNGQVGIGTTNPTAKLDVAGAASVSGALTFRGNSAGAIQTTSNQTLTLGGSSTGNIQINPLNQLSIKPGSNSVTAFQIQNAAGSAFFNADTINSRIGIGTTAPAAALDVRGTSGTLSVATVSGQTSFAALLANNDGSGDLFTASKSGATKFTILNNGNLKLNNYTSPNGLLYTDGTGVVQQLAEGLQSQCLAMNGTGDGLTWSACGTGGGGSSVFDTLAGAITPKIETQDLLLGGQATTSARFAFTNVLTGTPTASISATNGDALSLSANGSITTTMGQVLTLGGGNSGDVYTASHLHLDPVKGINGGGLSDCSNPTTSKLLWSASTNLFSCGTDQGGTGGGSLTVAESDSSNSVSAVAEVEFGPGTNSSDQFTLTNAGSGIAQITLGTKVPLLNQTETVASAWTFSSAITANSGIQTASGTNLSLTAAGSGNIVLNSDADTGVYVGSNSNTAAPLSVSGGIGSNGLAIFNQNNSGDILDASKSGALKFAIKNDGTASSAAGFTINGAGTIQSTNNNLLTLGSSTTGNILLYSDASKGVLIGSAANTAAPLSVSGGIGSNALAIFNQNNLGDILTASAAGQTKFRITNTGLVGIGSATPVAALQVVGGNQGGNAAMIVNQNGASANDLFAASASGTTKFVIKNDGTASSSAGFTIDGAGAIQSTKGQTLTVGGSGTGNIVFDPNSSSNGLTMISANSAISMTTNTTTGLTLDTGTTGTISIGTNANAKTIAIGNTTSNTTLTLDSGTGGISIGDDTSTKAINIGGSINNGSDTIRIATNATSADAISIGNANASTTMSLTGGSSWSITTAGAATAASLTLTGSGTNLTTASNANLIMTPNGTGQVGINTTTPRAELEVAGTASVGGQFTFESGTAQIQSSANQTLTVGGNSTGTIAISPNNGSGVLAINANGTTGVSINGTAGLTVTCSSANALNGFTSVDGIVTAGTCTANAHDIAEQYFSSQALEPGDVVETDATATQSAYVIKTANAYAQNTLGVVSTHPQTVLGGDDGGYPVALTGRIPVKVTLDAGSIGVGDYITSSSTQGFGMKAIVAGNTIGTALESTSNWNAVNCPVVSSIDSIVWPVDDGTNSAHPCFRIIAPDGNTQYVGKIMMFASLSYADPEVSVPASGNYDLLQNSELSLFDQSNNAASASGLMNAAYTIKDGAGIAVTSTTAFAKATIANIQAGAVVAKEISTDSLNVTTGNITLGGQTLSDYIKGIVKQTLSESDQNTSVAFVNGLVTATQSAQLVQTMLSQNDLSATVSGMTITGVLGADTINVKHIAGLSDLSATTVTAASISAQTITADTLNVKHISGLDVLTAGLKNDDARITALESLVATPSGTPSAPQAPAISPTEGITVLPNTTGQSSVSSDLRVKGNGLIEGVLHIVGTLFANDFIANGVADFFGNVIFHSGVTFQQTPTFNSDTAGIAIIKKGTDHIDVTFSKAYDQTPVINATITTVSLTPTPSETPDHMQQRQDEIEKTLLADNIHFIITNKTTKGFRILLDKPAEEDIAFSWLALSVQNPVIFQSNITPTPSDSLSPSPMDSIMPEEASTSAGF